MKKRILFLLHLPPPIHGSSVIGLIIKESSTINKEFKCSYINLLASQNVSESGIVSFNKILGFSVTFCKVFIALLRKRPQLCYLALSTTGAAFYRDVILVSLLKLFRIKLIYHLHNKGISRYQHKFFNHLGYNFVFRNTEVIILSDKLYSDIQSFVPFSKVHICPNGITDHGLQSKAHAPDEAVRILFLSNLIVTKGVFVLLEALSLLKQKGILFQGIFIGGEGDITASQFDERIHQLGLKNHVNYQGKKYGKEKEKAFSEADIFAFPTYHETFGLVILEAMQQSKPIISTYEGGIPDIVEDGVTGFLVKQKDVVALAEKLELLIQNPEIRHQMGAAGRKKYEKEFTLEKFEHQLTEILHQVIKTR